jgi:hypothetical protein
MPTQDSENRREYYRIDDSIALEILPHDELQGTPDEASPGVFQLLGELHQLDFEAQHLLRQIAEGNRTLANYLKVQNKRIDLLGQALAQDLLKTIGPARPVVLSEGGISFNHDQPLPPGGLYRLKLVLMPQALGLLLDARVTSCHPVDEGGYALAISFDALTDAQRQLLARHILQKQAAQRRQARDSLSGA